MGSKLCRICGQVKDQAAFYSKVNRGKVTRRATCDQKLVVDHNHQTRHVRGLLCHLCNALIGCARENIDILVSAAAYLYAELHPESPTVAAAITFRSDITGATSAPLGFPVRPNAFVEQHP